MQCCEQLRESNHGPYPHQATCEEVDPTSMKTHTMDELERPCSTRPRQICRLVAHPPTPAMHRSSDRGDSLRVPG